MDDLDFDDEAFAQLDALEKDFASSQEIPIDVIKPEEEIDRRLIKSEDGDVQSLRNGRIDHATIKEEPESKRVKLEQISPQKGSLDPNTFSMQEAGGTPDLEETEGTIYSHPSMSNITTRR